jgi:hypothetical protein
MTALVIRASSTPSFLDCERRTAARAWPHLIKDAGFEAREILPPVGAPIGTATHAGASFTLTEKLESGELGNHTEAIERGLQSFDEEAANGVTWDDTTAERNTAHQQIIRQISAYRANVAPRVAPVAVEKRLNADLGDGIIVSGQADLFTEGEVRDLKTGVRQRNNMAQYGTYALLARQHGHPVARVYEDFVKRVSPAKPQPEPISTESPAADAMPLAWAVLQRMKAALIAFRVSGDPMAFLPNPNSMLCSAKYCPAFGTNFCRAHLGALR